MEVESNPNIVVDRRSIWIVLLDRMRRKLLLAFIFAFFFFLLERSLPEGITLEGYKTLCLFFLCVSLWATNLIPLSITSLLAIAGIPLLGVMSSTEAYSFFGNKAIFFILGVFIISAAMTGSGLTGRLSMWVFETWGRTPRRLVGGVYLFGLFGSCFMSEHAVAAMLFPILLQIIQSLNLDTQKGAPFAKSLIFAMAWGCIIGGAATVLGGGRVPLAVEILEQATDGTRTIGILEYSTLSFPLVIILAICGWALLNIMFPPGDGDMEPARIVLRQKLAEMGRVSPREIGVGAVMLVTLFGWFYYGEELGIANVAILSITFLFLFNLINWNMVEEHVNWAVIIMYGGAICLGEAMVRTGAALWLAEQAFDSQTQSPLFFLVSIAVLSMLFTTFMSNSAVIAILIPPTLGIAPSYGIDLVLATMTVILPSNFAFILPIATPASALAYSSKLISLKDMIRSGVVLGVLGIFVFLFLYLAYWPALGFR
jgi:sodium-dependent dicarboxylate transporter 2/3/5